MSLSHFHVPGWSVVSRSRRFPGRPRRPRLRPTLDQLEDRLAPAGIINGDFSIADPNDPGFGFTIRGNGSVVGGVAVLNEGTVVQTGFTQTFTVPPNTTQLRFTIVMSDLVDNGASSPPDAFEVALLDATTMTPLVGPPTGLGNTDAFLNIQQSGEVFFAPEVTIPGAGTSGQVAMPNYPLVVTVDLSGVAAGTSAVLSFDLIGFTPASSSVRIDDVEALQGPAPPPVSFYLDSASDSGMVGDDLTRFNPVTLVGATDPDQVVELDLDGDGFNDGMTTANATGQFTFVGATLVEGANNVRVQATNNAGTTTATRTITLDTQSPTGSLELPMNGTTVNQDLGYVEVQWTDPGASGIDPSTYGVDDITIAGVDVDQFDDLGNGRVRYRYSLDNDALAAGPVNVTLVAGQVADLVGNLNAETTQSFTLTQANAVPVAMADMYTTDEDTKLTVPAAPASWSTTPTRATPSRPSWSATPRTARSR